MDYENGGVLYEDKDHRFIWLGGEVDLEEKTDGMVIETNQYLIINKKKGILLDPGGLYTFPRVLANTSIYTDTDDIEMIFYSHQDPDTTSGISLWLQNTPAKIYVSKLWLRFLAHFNVTEGYDRVVGIPDEGGTYTLPSGDILEFIPAHFLHSPGHFNVYDRRSKILFSGDIAASICSKEEQKIFFEKAESCTRFMEGFHKRYMASNKACRAWVEEIRKRDVNIIAPQHGSILKGDYVKWFLNWFENLQCGVDIIDQIYGKKT